MFSTLNRFWLKVFCMLNTFDVMDVKSLHVLGNKIPLWLFGFLY